MRHSALQARQAKAGLPSLDKHPQVILAMHVVNCGCEGVIMNLKVGPTTKQCQVAPLV